MFSSVTSMSKSCIYPAHWTCCIVGKEDMAGRTLLPFLYLTHCDRNVVTNKQSEL